MNKEKMFESNKETSYEAELIINQNLFDLKIIDYNTYQGFINYVLTKIKKAKMSMI